MFAIFVVCMAVISFGIWTIIRIKLRISTKDTVRFNHFNKLHKRGEIFVIAVLLVLYGVIIFSGTGPTAIKFYYLGLLLCLFWSFRAFMEQKFYKHTKQHLFSIVAAVCFLLVFLGAELVFYNPIPIELNGHQIREITLEYKESGQHAPVILTHIDSFEPIVKAVSDGAYMIGNWPVEPKLEMTITMVDGSEVVIGEHKSLQAETSVFTVYTDRRFFPREMIMSSQELELIFDQLVAKD